MLHIQFEDGYVPTKDIKIGFYSNNTTTNILNKNNNKKIITINDDQHSNTWYDIKELSEGVYVKNFSGRIYFCYGEAWRLIRKGYTPSPVNKEDDNYYKRYDQIELTFNGQKSDKINLSSINFWSIPLSLISLKNGKEVKKLNGVKSSATDIYNSLKKLSDPVRSHIKNKIINSALINDKDGNFVRIIGPSSYPPFEEGGLPIIPYHTFESYLQYLYNNFGPQTPIIKTIGDGTIANIDGYFCGVGPNVPLSGPLASQSYSLKATIEKDLNIILEGNCFPTNKTITSVGKIKIIINKNDLINPAGIYGSNVNYELQHFNYKTNKYDKKIKCIYGNDIYGKIIQDLLIGFNIGAIGSIKYYKDICIGTMTSYEWIHNLPKNERFSALQDKESHYNTWAATLQNLSDAYNNAYSDALGDILISLDPEKTDVLSVVFEKDVML